MILLLQYLSMGRSTQMPKAFLLLVMMLALGSATLVTFYVDHEVEQPLDYVDINLIVKTDGESLDEAIEEAAQKIKSIEGLVE